MTQEQIIAYWNGYIDGKNNTLDKYAKIKKQKIKAEEDFGSEYDCGYQAGYTVAKKECVTDNNKTSVDDDEEIRKEIRDFVCWAIDRGSITKEQREKSNSWLAYLEKQKEQKVDLTVKGNGVYKIYPHCKSRMIRDESKVYTSISPQYGYNCPKCGTMEFDTVMYDNPEMEEQKSTLNEDDEHFSLL